MTDRVGSIKLAAARIPGGKCMADRIRQKIVLFIPCARPQMKVSYLAGLLLHRGALAEHRQRDGDSDTTRACHRARNNQQVSAFEIF